MAVWNHTTIGLNEDIDTKLNFIKESLQFSDAQDAYKFCFSVEFIWSIEHDQTDVYSKDDGRESRKTKWATSGFDPDQTFSDLAHASAPEGFEGDFGKYVEIVGAAGVERVHDLIEKNEYFNISDIFNSVTLK